jgi:hypothetical protein
MLTTVLVAALGSVAVSASADAPNGGAAPIASTPPAAAPLPSGPYQLTLHITGVDGQALVPVESAVLPLAGTVSGDQIVLTQRAPVTPGSPTLTGTFQTGGTFVLNANLGDTRMILTGKRDGTSNSVTGRVTATVTGASAKNETGSFELGYVEPGPKYDGVNIDPKGGRGAQHVDQGRQGQTLQTYTGPGTNSNGSGTGSSSSSTTSSSPTSAPATPTSSSSNPGLWQSFKNWLGGLKIGGK